MVREDTNHGAVIRISSLLCGYLTHPQPLSSREGCLSANSPLNFRTP
jgi:hypothetical protein